METMKTTGIVRRIDDLGRVVIPKEIRKRIGVKEGDPFEIFISKDRSSLILQKYDFDSPIKRALKCLRVAAEEGDDEHREEFLLAIQELESYMIGEDRNS